MEDNDLASLLSKRGISADKAELIQNRLNGNDILNLIFDLKDGSQESIINANKILSNFDITIKENKMTYNHVIRSKLNLGKVLKENNIPYVKKMGDLFFMNINDKSKSLVENYIKESNKMNNNKRLMELAGITPSVSADVPDFDNDMGSSVDDTSSDDVYTDIPDDDFSASSEECPVVTDANDTVPVENSAELNQILDAFNNIQRLAPEVKVSELKPLLIKAEEFSAQMQNLANTYLN